MSRTALFASGLLALLAVGVAGAVRADDDDYPTWRPASDMAVTATGPVILFPDRFNAGAANFPWQEDGVVQQFKPDQGPIPARIYKLTQPANPDLLNGHKLCEGKTVDWIVMVPAPPAGLEIDVYAGAKPSGIGSPGLCATYLYKRWG